jgi:L-alanine-DL-glutamate epimerase-like enolase superfamily enzyme
MISTALNRRALVAGFVGPALFGPVNAQRLADRAGVKPPDLPNLTIREVKALVTDSGRIASIVTECGIEGLCALPSQIFHAGWDNRGWVQAAKRLLAGKSALARPQLTSQWLPVRRHYGQSAAASSIDICLWDIAGKAVGLPAYQLAGAYRERIPAYASSQHLDTKTPEPYVQAALKARGEGFRAFKVNPPPVRPDGDSHHRLDIAICQELRQALGDGFTLIHHGVGNYSRFEAMEVGRALDDLGFRGFEDPLPSNDIDGWAALSRSLRTPLILGEFVLSPYEFAEYIRREAAGALRFVVDNIGGITGGLKIATLAECFGLECMPHGVGGTLHQAAHLQCALAMPNAAYVEVPYPQGVRETEPYVKNPIRVAVDGSVEAPANPGLGCEIDFDALDRAIKSVER